MNLLFYSAVNADRIYVPTMRLGQHTGSRRSPNIRAVTKVLLFFRYFAPDRFKQYIDNCRRRNVDASRAILDSIPRGVDDFSAISYIMGSPSIKSRIATLLGSFDTDASQSLINHSFTWANTPQGRNVWERLDALYERFHAFITDNHISLDLSTMEYDRGLYPHLQNDNSLRDYLIPLPEYIEQATPRRSRRSGIYQTADVAADAVQQDARPPVSDIRFEGNNTYSYVGLDGQRHTIVMPSGSVTFTYTASNTAESTNE